MRITYRTVNGPVEAQVVASRIQYEVVTPSGRTMIVDERSVIEKKED